jgi:hypothetical protein
VEIKLLSEKSKTRFFLCGRSLSTVDETDHTVAHEPLFKIVCPDVEVLQYAFYLNDYDK